MPRWPKHPCKKPGCPNLVEKGKSFCEEHEKERNRMYERYGRKYDPKKRYNAGWKKVSALYRKSHPYCEECYREGRMVPAEHVHHIIPLGEGGTNDWDNLMSLCHSCHSRIHANRGDYWVCRGSSP